MPQDHLPAAMSSNTRGSPNAIGGAKTYVQSKVGGGLKQARPAVAEGLRQMAPVVKTRSQMFWAHLRRCFGWRLNRTQPTVYEADLLDGAGIEDRTLRSYFAWRRSQLLCSLPVLLSAAITGISRVSADKGSDRSNFVYNLPNISDFVLFIAVCGAVGLPRGVFHVWAKWRLSSIIIRIGFVISSILPIIPAIIPLKYLNSGYDLSSLAELAALAEAKRDNLSRGPFATDDFGVGAEELSKLSRLSEVADSAPALLSGFSTFIAVLPVLISFPAALVGGSLRIRGLLPHSTLSAWILTVAGPFLSIVKLTASILVIQFGGDATLMIGIFFQCFAPWIYVFWRKLYVGAPTEENEKKLDKIQTLYLLLNILGIVMIAVWCFTNDLLPESEQAADYVQFGLEIWGRFLATTVVLTDMLLRMTLSNWLIEKGERDMDVVYASIEKGVRKVGFLDDVLNDAVIDSLETQGASSGTTDELDKNDPESGTHVQSGDVFVIESSEDGAPRHSISV